jgi:hypothetical protein
VSYFYEFRTADNIVLKCDGGFASQGAAKMVAREDAKKIKKSSPQTGPCVGRILIGQNEEEATRY